MAVVKSVMHAVAKSEAPSKSGRAGKSRIAHREAFRGGVSVIRRYRGVGPSARQVADQETFQG